MTPAVRCRPAQFCPAQIDLQQRLQAVDILRRTRCSIPRIVEAILDIATGKARRTRWNENLVMDGGDSEGLGFRQNCQIDWTPVESQLAAQAMAFLLVEINVVIRVVEKPVVLLD